MTLVKEGLGHDGKWKSKKLLKAHSQRKLPIKRVDLDYSPLPGGPLSCEGRRQGVSCNSAIREESGKISRARRKKLCHPDKKKNRDTAGYQRSNEDFREKKK